MDIKLLKQFAKFCQNKMGIRKLPKIRLTTKRDEVKTTAGYKRGIEVIIYTKGRHQVDCYRSLAHELKHHKQWEDQEFTSTEKIQDVGGKYEDEANAVAGQMIKMFAYAGHMNIYENKQRLTEGRLEDAKRQYGDVSPKFIDYISVNDPSGNNKYLRWIIKQLRTQKLITPDLDQKGFVDKLLNVLKVYDSLLPYYSSNLLRSSNTLPLKVINHPKDINGYSNIEEVELANNIVLPWKELKDEEKAISRNSDVIYDDDDYLVIHIRTVPEAWHYGRDTKWCSGPNDQSCDIALKHQFVFYITNKKDTNLESNFSKIAVIIHKDMGNANYFRYLAPNNKPLSLPELIEYDPKLKNIITSISIWREMGNLKTVENIQRSDPRLYALSQYLKDDMLNHYKIDPTNPKYDFVAGMDDYTYNTGKIEEKYSVGQLSDVQNTAKMVYLDQIKQNPKLLLRYQELLPQALKIMPLMDLVLDHLGFNNLYFDSQLIHNRIKNIYPIPPIKLKTDQIHNNDSSLTDIEQIDRDIARIDDDIKTQQKLIQTHDKEIGKYDEVITKLQDKLNVFKIRAEQVKDDNKRHQDLQMKISEYTRAIEHNEGGRKDRQNMMSILADKVNELQQEKGKLSDEYTEIINQIEGVNINKDNYEYSQQQINTIRDKIYNEVNANPIKWIETLKLRPDELIQYVNLNRIIHLMSEKLIEKIKSFGSYKFIDSVDVDRITYYIFTKENNDN